MYKYPIIPLILMLIMIQAIPPSYTVLSGSIVIVVNEDSLFNATITMEPGLEAGVNTYNLTLKYTNTRYILEIEASYRRELGIIKQYIHAERLHDKIIYSMNVSTSDYILKRIITARISGDSIDIILLNLTLHTGNVKIYNYIQLLVSTIILKYNVSRSNLEIIKKAGREYYMNILLRNTSFNISDVVEDEDLAGLLSKPFTRLTMISFARYEYVEIINGYRYLYREYLTGVKLLSTRFNEAMNITIYKDPSTTYKVNIVNTSLIKPTIDSSINISTTKYMNKLVSRITITNYEGMGRDLGEKVRNIIRNFINILDTGRIIVYGRGVSFIYNGVETGKLILEPGEEPGLVEVSIASSNKGKGGVQDYVYYLLFAGAMILILYILYRFRRLHR